MRMSRASLVAALLVVCAAAVAAQSATAPIPPGGVTQGTLSFDGRGTPGPFTGTTTTVTGEMTGGRELAEVRGWVEAPVATLRTANDRRDGDLRKSMETDKYPTMRFDLDSVSGAAGTGDTAQLALTGRLRIHGVERRVSLPASVVVGQDRVRVHSDFPLNLKDYQIGGLTKLMGLLRMSEKIVVHVDLTFGPPPER